MRKGLPKSRFRFELSALALERWTPSLQASAVDPATSITIYDQIGADWWTGEGTTAKRISGALRAIGDKHATVYVNSPGGDVFEGLAIYNLLREHQAGVTVKVVGVAASAAAIIAMAGSRIEVARAGFLMIHNSWTVAIGNQHDMRETADWLAPFDKTQVDIFAARTGDSPEKIAKMLDAETWIGGQEAVDTGFADALLPADEVTEAEEAPAAASVRRLENSLRASGLSRKDAATLISDFKASLRDAAEPTPDQRDAVEIATLAAKAASLTSLLENHNV